MANGFRGLLGNMVFPQLVNQNVTNKQLIDAAILRGSLEFLKPRQAGENLASQASRALEAGSQFGKDVFEQQQSALETLLKQQKLAQEKTPSQVTITDSKQFAFEDAIIGLYDISPEVRAAVDILGGKGGFSSPGVVALSAEAISVQSANPKLSITEAAKEAAKNIDKFSEIN